MNTTQCRGLWYVPGDEKYHLTSTPTSSTSEMTVKRMLICLFISGRSSINTLFIKLYMLLRKISESIWNWRFTTTKFVQSPRVPACSFKTRQCFHILVIAIFYNRKTLIYSHCIPRCLRILKIIVRGPRVRQALLQCQNITRNGDRHASQLSPSAEKDVKFMMGAHCKLAAIMIRPWKISIEPLAHHYRRKISKYKLNINDAKLRASTASLRAETTTSNYQIHLQLKILKMNHPSFLLFVNWAGGSTTTLTVRRDDDPWIQKTDLHVCAGRQTEITITLKHHYCDECLRSAIHVDFTM